ncbi:MAG: biotin--[acetyl-CoA-carboxylase] ligase [Candidatus Hydrogenedentota bacterium]
MIRKTSGRSSRNAISVARVKRETFVRSIEYHRAYPSTNTRAMEIAEDASSAVPALVITEIQTAGRGRGDNVWWSAAGALTYSLVLDLKNRQSNPLSWPTFALATAVAVCETLEARDPELEFGIRWPNDVFCGNRKICGILPELCGTSRLVLGIGVNVNNAMVEAPEALRQTAVSLIDLTGKRWNLTETLIALLQTLERRFDDPELPAAWAKRCLLRGHQVTVRFETRESTGLCKGIEPNGALLLEIGNTCERFYGGTIVRIDDEPTSSA